MIVVSRPPYFCLFPRLKIKLKGRHFDTNEVIEAESQAVLNTLTEQGYQDAFKKNSSFSPDGITSLGNYGWLFIWRSPRN
jgi:hypothetical protein